MPQAELPCAAESGSARTLRAVRPNGRDAFVAGLSQGQQAFLAAAGFEAKAQELLLLPDATDGATAVLGLGDEHGPYAFGDLAFRLPPGDWRIEPGDFDMETAALGFCLGSYRFRQFKNGPRPAARLIVAGLPERALSLASCVAFARDLINMPANLLGPAELADAACELGQAFGAASQRITGDALLAAYPTVAAVGRGSERAPVVAKFSWRGSTATDASPLVSLCGKGVCFDSGGYDLKPSSGMLRMKKDMGGAAVVLGIARALMASDAPIRLDVKVGCVENSVSGAAMRPLDVLRTRHGLAVEIGNTDAEGRLVLCDLLSEACEEKPDFLLDCATLTGAARVALGPDLPALFCNDDEWAAALLSAGTATYDPMWRMPLWKGYDPWLSSDVADLNNVSSKPLAGAVTAALFLQRFVATGVAWAHLDLYGWNDAKRPGRPEGGEAHCVRSVYYAIVNRLGVTQ